VLLKNLCAIIGKNNNKVNPKQEEKWWYFVNKIYFLRLKTIKIRNRIILQKKRTKKQLSQVLMLKYIKNKNKDKA
jgi:hypothetical protein